MKDREIDDLIERVKGMPLPECPGLLEQNVLRRIRPTGHETNQSLLDWVLGLLPQPSVLLTAVVGAITISSGVTLAANLTQNTIQQSRYLASEALDFGVFQVRDILNLDDR